MVSDDILKKYTNHDNKKILDSSPFIVYFSPAYHYPNRSRYPMSQKKTATLRLILGDQLNRAHSWFRRKDPSVIYLLMEVAQETSYVRHHIQKIAAFFAAMRAFADDLRRTGHRVIYLQLDDPDNRHTFADNITRLIEHHNIARFEYQHPDEYRLDRHLTELCKTLPVSSAAVDSEHFLTARGDIEAFFAGKKTYLMESFYRHMRRTHNILMDSGKPLGGKWNYDIQNRKAYDDTIPVPAPKVFTNDVSDIIEMLSEENIDSFGEIVPNHLIWPVTRRQALSLLRFFITHCLPSFGLYQDAMAAAHWALFHSRLSFALNTKMLHPREVIDAAVDAYWADNSIDIAQVEGFVRQILGWREYMRGVYWAHMPEYASGNYFNHTAHLPRYYWDDRTNMNCLRHAIGQSLKHAYAHHIQRLMITGNFALIAGVNPDEVDRWYLGVYIDAVEWVEITNTRGMSQFADGGLVATKPYVSTARYINTMSDYCRDCRYSHTKKHGNGACPFNCLHWDFYNRHHRLLRKNPRVGMMYRVWDKMSSDEKRKILAQAQKYRGDLDIL
jgi:deoxyribodipyrimidine photolyase-related protein